MPDRSLTDAELAKIPLREVFANYRALQARVTELEENLTDAAAQLGLAEVALRNYKIGAERGAVQVPGHGWQVHPTEARLAAAQEALTWIFSYELVADDERYVSVSRKAIARARAVLAGRDEPAEPLAEEGATKSAAAQPDAASATGPVPSSVSAEPGEPREEGVPARGAGVIQQGELDSRAPSSVSAEPGEAPEPAKCGETFDLLLTDPGYKGVRTYTCTLARGHDGAHVGGALMWPRLCDYHFDPYGGCEGVYGEDGLCDQCGRPRLREPSPHARTRDEAILIAGGPVRWPTDPPFVPDLALIRERMPSRSLSDRQAYLVHALRHFEDVLSYAERLAGAVPAVDKPRCTCAPDYDWER